MSDTEPLHRDVLYLSSELVARIDRHAREAGALLRREVPGEVVVREAVTAWLRAVNTRPTTVEFEAIHQSIRSIAELEPHPQQWTKAMAMQLDLIANTAGRALVCEVSRSTVVRAALAFTLEDAEHTRSKEVTAEESQAALVAPEEQVES
ncbi:MAG: hypothetical protein ACMG6S_33170 [Byssovorax sp.]